MVFRCTRSICYLGRMAEVDYHCSTDALDLGVRYAQEPVCKCCNGHLSEIASLNTELHSARKIIQLLQYDLNGIKNQLPRNELTAPQVSDAPNGWKTIAARTSNPSNQRYYPKNTPNYKKPIPAIQTSNRFHVLHNLQAAQMETSYISKRTPETQRNINQTSKKKMVYTVKRTEPLKKITLIGDSHIRGLAAELRKLMGREYSISSTFLPGARLQSITKLAKCEIDTLTRSDTVIVCGGSNDACRNESQTGC